VTACRQARHHSLESLPRPPRPIPHGRAHLFFGARLLPQPAWRLQLPLRGRGPLHQQHCARVCSRGASGPARSRREWSPPRGRGGGARVNCLHGSTSAAGLHGSTSAAGLHGSTSAAGPAVDDEANDSSLIALARNAPRPHSTVNAPRRAICERRQGSCAATGEQ